MKASFQRSYKIKEGAKKRLLLLSAGKEGLSSNRFKEDLVHIIDFLKENKREISMINREE